MDLLWSIVSWFIPHGIHQLLGLNGTLRITYVPPTEGETKTIIVHPTVIQIHPAELVARKRKLRKVRPMATLTPEQLEMTRSNLRKVNCVDETLRKEMMARRKLIECDA